MFLAPRISARSSSSHERDTSQPNSRARSLASARARASGRSRPTCDPCVAGSRQAALHFAGIRHYGFFRDELYYMACGEHLAWGYVDQPPLIALRRVDFASSARQFVISLRLHARAGGRRRRFPDGRAGARAGRREIRAISGRCGILLRTAYLAFDSFFSMNAFEPLFWLVCAWIVVRIVKGASPRLWLAFGAVAGVGLENKHTMLVFGFALWRDWCCRANGTLFRSPWIWIGGADRAGRFFCRTCCGKRATAGRRSKWCATRSVYKNIPISPLRFLGEQIVFMHPLALPVWLGGLAWLFFARDREAISISRLGVFDRAGRVYFSRRKIVLRAAVLSDADGGRRRRVRADSRR